MNQNIANTEKLINQYKDLAIQHSDGSKTGAYKKANKAYAKLKKLYEKFRQDDALAEKVLTACIRSDDVGVRIWAAAHFLGLNKHVGEAEKVLAEISMMDDIGILSLNAEMTLKIWKKQGYLKP